jgi:predicted nucleic acid-binding protein
MYLWDTNIIRHFGQGHPTLRLHLERIPWVEIALPSVVLAEILRGRCDFALKASPTEAPLAHKRLLETQQMLSHFHIVPFDDACALVLERLRRSHRRRKRYADLMIAAMAEAGGHVVVTRNQDDFVDLLPQSRLMNWIDNPPKA